MKYLIFFSLFASSLSFAATHSWKSEKFNLNVPSEWQSMNDFFGIPVTFLGPQINKDPRTVIQVIPTDAQPLKMEEKELTSFNSDFEKRKKDWLSKREGVLYGLLPASFEKFGKEKMIVAGLSYKIGDASFIEKTYYINCPSKLYQLKLLVKLGESARLSAGEDIVRSFTCAP